MIGRWNPIDDEERVYTARQTTGTGRESAPLGVIRDGLATGAMAVLGGHGLTAAYGHTPSGVAARAPFYVTLPPDGGQIDFEQITLGGDPGLNGHPGGWVGLHPHLNQHLVVGPSSADFADLLTAVDVWLLPFVRFLLHNQTVNGRAWGLSLQAGLTQMDIHWGQNTWYALTAHTVLDLEYLIGAG